MDKNKIIGLIVIVGLAYLVYTMMSADGGNTWTEEGCYKDGELVANTDQAACVEDGQEWKKQGCTDAEGNPITDASVTDKKTCEAYEAKPDNGNEN